MQRLFQAKNDTDASMNPSSRSAEAKILVTMATNIESLTATVTTTEQGLSHER